MEILTCYGNSGLACHGLGNFKKAIEYYEKSLKIAEEINGKSGKADCYTGLGLIYEDTGNYKKALTCHEKALEIAREVNNKYGELKCLMNIGMTYKYGELKCLMNIGMTYQWMVSLCINLEKKEEAFEYAEKSRSRAFLDLLAATV